MSVMSALFDDFQCNSTFRYRLVFLLKDFEIENKKLRETLNEYNTEFAEVKNQEVTINRLREKVREYEDKIEDTAKIRVKDKEKELQKIFAERERQLQETQLEVAKKLGETEQEVVALKAALESAQSELFDVKSKLDEENEARGSAIELLEADVERASQRALLAERYVESLTEQLNQVKSELQTSDEKSRPNVDDAFHSISRATLERELSAKEKEIGQLVEDIQRLQAAMNKMREAGIHQVTSLEEQLASKSEAIHKLRTLQTGFTIKLAALPLGVLAIFLLYVDINIDPILRSEKIHSATTYVLAGVFVLECVGKYFPVVGMVVLVIRHVIAFEKTLYIANVAVFFPDLRKLLNQFSWPLTYASALFFVILQRYVRLFPLNSRLRTVHVVINNVCLNWIVSMIYIYNLLPMVMDTKDETKQVILLAITPFLPVIPVVICDRCTLIEISKITNRVYGFVFVCLSRGIVISLCRIIQADFTSIWLFMGVSLSLGFLKVAGKATEELRGNVMAYFLDLQEIPNLQGSWQISKSKISCLNG
ncbi:homeobox cut-like 1 isoform X1 [Paramuricea clavata]|uniref:Homeobox cut-like 1 isoform X1 n=1 Tax=Paramuricea clavata TaxID=317549 RepID=A0A7D9IGS2_PARCT|nr:homeobox cut-like 1 isoform X1 [Paramuricea clavata]